MKSRLCILMLFGLALSLISCAAAAPSQLGSRGLDNSAKSAPSSLQPVPMALPPTVAPAATSAPAQGYSSESSNPAVTGGSAQNVPSAASAARMIVYTANLSLEVQDTDKALGDITTIVTQYKGYVAATNMARDSAGNMRGTVTLRIPAESLDAAQTQIEAKGLKVLSRNKNSNDVTDQYTDLNARLKNLTATENELRQMLDTVRENSGKAQDILAIYNQLTEIRGQIEQIQGQMNVLDKTSSFATLTVELVPNEEVQVLEPDTWVPNRTAAEALKALVQALEGLVNLAIWLVLFLLPIVIVLALPFLILALILRSVLRRRKKVPAPAP